MKVRVVLSVDVDPEAWALIYGTAPEDIASDVHTYVVGQVQGSAAADEGAITDVTDKSPQRSSGR